MAPESERAKCTDCGQPKDNPRYHHDAPGENWGAALHWYVPPTSLTCSEVVERLATEAHGEHCFDASFDREKATAILNEWREQIRKGE